MKRIAVSVLVSLLMMTGCTKKQETTTKESTSITQETRSSTESTGSTSSSREEVKSSLSSKQETRETKSSVSSSQSIQKSFKAKYNLRDGEYFNSPEGGTPYMCVAVIKQVDGQSFEFTIYQVCDSEGENFDHRKLIFKTHVARFDSRDAKKAVFKGEKYTLSFECNYKYSFVLSGYKAATRCSSTYSLSEAGSEYFGE
ncbi:MAG: hypothetical protein ACSW8B_04300 [bacterium]